ncbi:MAG: hypothetical protein KGM98_04565 [Bacteroidota bacterium]|nr:hypothetical protein [Bacteroidota bacterium]
MKKILLSLVITIFAASLKVEAQEYQTALGAKFYATDFTSGGINIRHATSQKNALEGTLLFFDGGLGVEGLYEFQGPINGAPGLQYYVGGGGMLAFGTGRFNNNSTAFALRLTGGLDYKFTDVPIDLSLGFDPFFYLAPATGSDLSLGLGIRYVIK